MTRLLSLDLGVTESLTLEEEGATAILEPARTGEVGIKMPVRLSPEAAVALSRALAKFAMRHLPEHMHQEISDGIPTLSPEFDTTAVGSSPPSPHRTSG